MMARQIETLDRRAEHGPLARMPALAVSLSCRLNFLPATSSPYVTRFDESFLTLTTPSLMVS